MNDALKKTDPQIMVELARAARDLNEDRAFKVAVAALHKQWLGELISDTIDEEKARNLRAKLQALEAIPNMLNNLMNGPKFAQQVPRNV